MVEKIVAPSGLHLKKELSALRKARFLQDPETCSSWRSPLSSKSVSANHFCHDTEIRYISTGEKISGVLLKIPRRHEKRRKQVYLCNWKNRSSISGESGINLNEDEKQLSVGCSSEDKLSNSKREETVGDRKLVSAGATNIYNITGRDLTTLRSSATRLKKIANSKGQGVKHSSITKQRNLPVSPLGVLSSIEQSDETEYCNSEEAQDLGFEPLRKAAYHSPSASSLFPGSGCANWSRTSKLFKSTRRESSSHSCTPASTSSYYRKIVRKPSTVGSGSGTTVSFEGDGFDQLDLPVRQRCGLPCYRSMRNRDKGCGDCYSLALSDTTLKKGGCIFGRRQTLYNKQRPTGFTKPKLFSTSPKGSPLLKSNYNDTSSDELSANLREIDLEALSRLNGGRWSSCKSQEAFGSTEPGERSLDNAYKKSLNLMHKPRTFDEIVGQNIVVQSLMNAILRRKIAPAYLFHGPLGTGKKSAARIFATALNCLSTEGNKPCYLCKECTAFYGESGSLVIETSASNKKSIGRLGYFLKNMTMSSRQLQYRIFIIDECHLLTSKMWYKFLRFLENPVSHVVFIFVTVDHEHLPRAIVSRVQKYFFSKIKDADIIRQLRRLAASENLDIEMDSLSLIAVNADGSLQNAETMLYQLGAFGKKITTSLVNDLMGIISDEKLHDLLEVAMSSNTSETVKRTRELMDSGVDPMSLLSQLAGLIMDIIGGTKHLADSNFDDVVLGGRSLTEYDLKRLEQALKILSDAEKQLKHSSEHSSLLTTALLQLSSTKNVESAEPNISGKQAPAKMNNIKKCSAFSSRSSNLLAIRESSSAIVPSIRNNRPTSCGYQTPFRMLKAVVPAKIQSVNRGSSDDSLLLYETSQNTWKLSEIWRACIEKCYSKTLRKLLSIHGKLVSLTENEGILIAFIAFVDSSIKLRAERYSNSIVNLLEMVLKQDVRVRMGLLSDGRINFKPPLDSLSEQHIEKLEFLDNQRKMLTGDMKGLRYKDEAIFPWKTRDAFDGAGHKKLEKCSSSLPQAASFQSGSSSGSLEENDGSCASKEKGVEISVLDMHTKASNKHKLEKAWMHAAEKGISGFPVLSKTEKNLDIHHNGWNGQLFYDPSVLMDRPLKCWEDDRNHGINAIKLYDINAPHKSQVGGDKINYAISPSLLYSNNFGNNFGKENLEDESGPGCSGLFCWKTNRLHRSQLKRGVHRRFQKARHILFCGQRVKSMTRGSTSRI